MREIEYVLPRGWEAVDLTADLAPQIDLLTRRLTQEEPAAEQVRVVVDASLRESLSGLREQGAELFLTEAEPFGGVLTGVSITVFPFPPELGDNPMDTLVSVASQTPGAVVLEAGELVVLRTLESDDVTETVRAQMAESAKGLEGLKELDPQEVEALRTTATYYVGDPDKPDDWMVMVAQMSSQGDEAGQDLKDKLLGLCDATVQSVRFV